MYNTQITGNTIIRKENRQHKRTDFRQQIFTYLIHIKKDFSSIDTRLFTASTKDIMPFWVYTVSVTKTITCKG